MEQLKRLIQEIHRRSLWQVLAIYVGASWAVLEAADVLIDRLALPSWIYGLAIVLLLVGLPVVLATAFVQEGMAAGGSGAEAPVGPTEAAVEARSEAGEVRGLRRLLTWRNALFGGMAAFAVWGLIAAAWLLVAGPPSSAITAADRQQQSIAVLPFDNIGDAEENRAFTEGTHDEIISHLSKIGDLKVISRTSVMEYADEVPNLRTVAEQLDVTHVLEGSVRRAGDRVRITAQLIEAEEDEHLWAENYQRRLSDIFAVQADVARKVAAALQATLTENEIEQIESKPTENPEAYEYYLRARVAAGYDTTVALLERAVELDPDFAEAWAMLARRRIVASFTSMDVGLRRRGIRALERAEDLAPDGFETHVARAFYHTFVTQDMERALEQIRLARNLRPNDADAVSYEASGLLRTGRDDEGLAMLEKAAELDPLNPAVARLLALTYRRRGDFAEAERYFDRAIALNPREPAGYDVKFRFLLGTLGDTARARELAYRHPEGPEPALTLLAYLRREYDEALDFYLSEPLREAHFGIVNWAQLQRIYGILGDPERVRSLSDSVRGDLEEELDEAIRAQAAPTVIAFLHSHVGTQYAALGDREAATRHAEQALEKYRISADARNYGILLGNLTNLYVWLGDEDRAIDLLEERFGFEAGRTAWYRLNPFYDPLRDNPRFQALLDRYERPAGV